MKHGLCVLINVAAVSNYNVSQWEYCFAASFERMDSEAMGISDTKQKFMCLPSNTGKGVYVVYKAQFTGHLI